MLNYDTENLDSEEIFSSLCGVTEAIQTFSIRSQEDLMDPQSRDVASPDSDPRLCGYPVESGRMALDNKTSLLNTPSLPSFTGLRFRDYNPSNYTDGLGQKTAQFEDAVEQLRDGENEFLLTRYAVSSAL